jgi:hypothetical protein
MRFFKNPKIGFKVDTSNMKNVIWHETQARLNENLLTLCEIIGSSHLTCRLKISFNFF